MLYRKWGKKLEHRAYPHGPHDGFVPCWRALRIRVVHHVVGAKHAWASYLKNLNLTKCPFKDGSYGLVVERQGCRDLANILTTGLQ